MTHSIAALSRTSTGRRAKTLHATGQIPAVVYGHGVPPKSIQIGRSDFRVLYRDAGTSSVIDLVVDGAAPVKALIQEVQVFPVSLEPFHIDFRQIRMDQEITLDVPLRFVGDSKAVKELAGTPIFALNRIEVSCLPGNLPHEISVDLSAIATFDDHITIGSLALPEGVRAVGDLDSVIVSVTRPLTEDELKRLEASESTVDVTAIKTEAEEKKAAEAQKKAEEESKE